jgi:hypothetical protein
VHQRHRVDDLDGASRLFWRDPAMVRRWAGTGMIEAQRSFRRIKGCKDMEHIVDAVCAEEPDASPKTKGRVVTPAKYDQAAA